MLRAGGDEVGKNVRINTTLPCSFLPGRITLAPNKDEFKDMISSKGEKAKTKPREGGAGEQRDSEGSRGPWVEKNESPKSKWQARVLLRVSLGIGVLGDLEPAELSDDGLLVPNGLSHCGSVHVGLLEIVDAHDLRLWTSSRLDLQPALVTEVQQADEAVGSREVRELVRRVDLCERVDDGGEDTRFRDLAFWWWCDGLRSKGKKHGSEIAGQKAS